MGVFIYFYKLKLEISENMELSEKNEKKLKLLHLNRLLIRGMNQSKFKLFVLPCVGRHPDQQFCHVLHVKLQFGQLFHHQHQLLDGFGFLSVTAAVLDVLSCLSVQMILRFINTSVENVDSS